MVLLFWEPIRNRSFPVLSRKFGAPAVAVGIYGLTEKQEAISELNVDNWNDNCEAKSEAKSPSPLRRLQVDFSLTRNVSYAVR